MDTSGRQIDQLVIKSSFMETGQFRKNPDKNEALIIPILSYRAYVGALVDRLRHFREIYNLIPKEDPAYELAKKGLEEAYSDLVLIGLSPRALRQVDSIIGTRHQPPQ